MVAGLDRTRVEDFALSPDGRRLVLVNTSLSGGFAARYAETGELCEEATLTHVVYVDGLRCRADEGRVDLGDLGRRARKVLAATARPSETEPLF